MMIIGLIIFSSIYFTSDMEFDEVLPIFGGVMAVRVGIPSASCGSAGDARETYCGKCGAILLKGWPTACTPPVQTPTYTPQTNKANFCPDCGARSNGGAFCTECGTKL